MTCHATAAASADAAVFACCPLPGQRELTHASDAGETSANVRRLRTAPNMRSGSTGPGATEAHGTDSLPHSPTTTGTATLRTASRDDASAIAALFADVYESSSHPCSDPAYVDAMLSSGTWSMVVAEVADRLVGCAAVMRLPVPNVYSPCYLVTRRDCRGQGHSSALYARIAAITLARSDCALILQIPRTRVSHRVAREGIGLPLLVFGHDGAMNVAFGVRETHIIALSFNPTAGIVRARPPRPLAPVERRMRRAGCVTTVTAHPRSFSVPGIDAGLTLGANPSCVQLVVPDDAGSAAEALVAIDMQGIRLQHVEHQFVFVPVAHRSLVDGLHCRAFRASAYVPAWLPEDGVRHDCVLMTRFTGDAARCNGLERLVSAWDGALHGFGAAA